MKNISCVLLLFLAAFIHQSISSTRIAHTSLRASTDTGVSFSILPGRGVDIGTGADGNVWVVGREVNGVNTIYRLVNGNWQSTGAVGVEVSGDNKGGAWFIGHDTNIYRINNGSIQKVPGQAVSISAEYGTTWIIGRDGSPYRWTGSTWEQLPGYGLRIAAAPGGGAYLVDNNYNLYSWTGSDWQQLDRFTATDVAVAPNGSFFVLLNNKFRLGSNVCDIDGTILGGVIATSIAVGADSKLYFVDANGGIFKLG